MIEPTKQGGNLDVVSPFIRFITDSIGRRCIVMNWQAASKSSLFPRFANYQRAETP
jgi:hypothetical protein